MNLLVDVSVTLRHSVQLSEKKKEGIHKSRICPLKVFLLF